MPGLKPVGHMQQSISLGFERGQEESCLQVHVTPFSLHSPFQTGLNRHKLSEAMVGTSQRVDLLVDEFVQGQYVSVALDSWTDVTKVVPHFFSLFLGGLF